MSVHQGRTLTAAIVSALEAASIDVGEGEAPTSGVGWSGSPGASTFTPYVVVHAVTGGGFDGPIGDPDQDAAVDYVLTSIGGTQAQAQWMNDLVYSTLKSATLSVSGRSVLRVRPDVEGGAQRDDDATPPVWFSPTRWRVFTTTT